MAGLLVLYTVPGAGDIDPMLFGLTLIVNVLVLAVVLKPLPFQILARDGDRQLSVRTDIQPHPYTDHALVADQPTYAI